MQKLKKIVSSSTCLLLLVAFTGAISLKFDSLTVPKPRAEVSQATLYPAINLSLISEEKDDANDQHQMAAPPIDLFITTFVFLVSGYLLFTAQHDSEKYFHKNSRVILFRSLRV